MGGQIEKSFLRLVRRKAERLTQKQLAQRSNLFLFLFGFKWFYYSLQKYPEERWDSFAA